MSLFIVLTGISTCLKVWILWLGIRRRQIYQFRWFFLYVVYAFAESAARVSVSNNYGAYLYVYWSSEVLHLTLLSIAIGESFFRTLRPFAQLRGVRTAFWICIALPVLYSVTRSILEPPTELNRWTRIIIGIEITLDYLVIAMMLLYFFLAHLFRIRDHRYESGIILGFGLNASISACGYLVWSLFGNRFIWLSGGLPPVAFVVAEGFWVATFMRPPAEPEAPPSLKLTTDEILGMLDQHLEVLRRLLSNRFP